MPFCLPTVAGMVHHISSQSRVHTDRRDLHNLKSMLPFLWEYRGRALFALGCLVFAKLANVGIPLVLKEIVDGLEKSVHTVLVLPLFLLIGYGVLRLAAPCSMSCVTPSLPGYATGRCGTSPPRY